MKKDHFESVLNESVKNGFLALYHDKRLLLPFFIMLAMSSLLLFSFYANVSVNSFSSEKTFSLNYYAIAGFTDFMPVYMFLISLVIFGAVTVFAVAISVSLYMNKLDRKSMPRPLMNALKTYPLLFWSGLIKWALVIASVFVLVVPSVFFFIRFSFSAQEIVLHKTGPISALKRSYNLTSRRFWEVFGVASALVALFVALNFVLNLFSLSLYVAAIGSSAIFSFLFIFFVTSSTHYFMSLKANYEI